MCWEGGLSFMAEMGGCFGCFGFLRKPTKPILPPPPPPSPPSSSSSSPATSGDGARAIYSRGFSEECLLSDDAFIDDGHSFLHDRSNHSSLQVYPRRSEEILLSRINHGFFVCRQFPVRETRHVTRSEDAIGNKMINEYVREGKIGSGSYGKVVLYRSTRDGKQYAMKIFHKSHLAKRRVAPSETAMSDVLREVSIMKVVEHPNIVNLIEVIDDPNTDHFYMVLEYVQGKRVCEGSGPPGGLGESTARRYMRGIIAGLMYLHSHCIVHGDIKPDNLLVTSEGEVKIGDFSVSQVFEDDNDELRRSPGTPVFTAPECCLGLTYHGRTADTWAVGVTLYCMIFGKYPFLGETLQDTYEKIANNPLCIPWDINPSLRNLLEGLLCKDPQKRMSLDASAEHPWVMGEDGPIPPYLCWCRRKEDRGREDLT